MTLGDVQETWSAARSPECESLAALCGLDVASIRREVAQICVAGPLLERDFSFVRHAAPRVSG